MEGGVFHTANFKLREEEKGIFLEIQLNRGVFPSLELEEKYKNAIGKFLKVPLRIRLSTLEAFPYPLDYERKFRYV